MSLHSILFAGKMKLLHLMAKCSHCHQKPLPTGSKVEDKSPASPKVLVSFLPGVVIVYTIIEIASISQALMNTHLPVLLALPEKMPGVCGATWTGDPCLLLHWYCGNTFPPVLPCVLLSSPQAGLVRVQRPPC